MEALSPWARWLLAEGKGREAADVVQRARVELDGASKLALEEGWRRVCDESTKREEKEQSEDAMDEDVPMDQDQDSKPQGSKPSGEDLSQYNLDDYDNDEMEAASK